MTTATELKENSRISYDMDPKDSGHIIVKIYLDEGTKEILGHIYVEIDGEETKYICTNHKKREIFPPTTDFNTVDMKYERYGKLLLEGRLTNKNYQALINNKSNFKNQNQMKNQPTEQKSKKENQFRFIEYEKPAGDGHFVTIMDSYRNVIGRVHKSYNEETKKYEYVAFDHAGNLFAKNEKLWMVKNEFINNREQLLEQAHQRRLVSKENAKEVSNERTHKAQTTKTEERKNEIGNLRQGKAEKGKQNERTVAEPEDKSNEKTGGIADRSSTENNSREADEQNRYDEREQELDDLRNGQDDDRGDMEVEF